MRVTVACVASVSSRVIARKLEREPKKKNGRGRGKEDTLARKPHDSGKRPLIFLGCRVIKKLLFSTFERRNHVLV